MDDFHANHECPTESAFRARAEVAYAALVQRGFVNVQSDVEAKRAFLDAWDSQRECRGRLAT